MAINSSDNDRFADVRYLTMREVCELVHYSRTHIYRLEKKGEFPRRRKIGPGRIGFLESEVHHWMKSRPLAPMLPTHSDAWMGAPL